MLCELDGGSKGFAKDCYARFSIVQRGIPGALAVYKVGKDFVRLHSGVTHETGEIRFPSAKEISCLDSSIATEKLPLVTWQAEYTAGMWIRLFPYLAFYGGLIVDEEFSPITSNFSSVSDENECGGKLAMRAKVVKYEFEFDTQGVSLACMARIAAMQMWHGEVL